MSAYTALCPSCNTELNLTHQEMQKADGDIICGNCDHRFHAPDHLLKGFFPSRAQTETSQTPAKKDAPSKIDLMDDILTPGNSSSYVSYKRKKRIRVFFGLMVNAGLIALFLFQLAWVRFDDWSAKENLRPIYSFLCAVRNLNCNLPAFVEPSALVLEDVQVDLRDNLVYVVQASIRNRSNHPQSFPWVEMIFTDINNVRLASGRFSPDQYLVNRASNSDTFIISKGNADILLEIRRPVGEATNYRMRLIAVAP